MGRAGEEIGGLERRVDQLFCLNWKLTVLGFYESAGLCAGLRQHLYELLLSNFYERTGNGA